MIFFGTRYFLRAALQTLLKIKSLQCIFGILKVVISKTNSEHGFYSPSALLVFLTVHNALQRNISNYVNRVDVWILKNMLISIKFFLYPEIIKFMHQFLWKGEIFGRNCSSFGSNEDSTFHFHPAQLPDAFLTTLARCLRRKIFDWGFKKMWIIFFRFLLNLKFRWKRHSVSCVNKTIMFLKVRKPFRVSTCGLLQKTKNCSS